MSGAVAVPENPAAAAAVTAGSPATGAGPVAGPGKSPRTATGAARAGRDPAAASPVSWLLALTIAGSVGLYLFLNWQAVAGPASDLLEALTR